MIYGLTLKMINIILMILDTFISNNEINSGLSISYNQLKENKKFISSNISSTISYESLFTDQKFVNLNLDLEGRVTLKNHLTVFMETCRY